MLRRKFDRFQFNHDKTVQLHVVKQKINEKIVSIYVQMDLAAIKGETCTKFQQESRHILRQIIFKLSLGKFLR